MRKHKNKIIAGVIITMILVLVYWWGGDAPSLRGWKVSSVGTLKQVQHESKNPNLTETPEQTVKVKKTDDAATEENRPTAKDNEQMTAKDKIELAEQMAGNTASNTYVGSEKYSQQKGMDINESTGKDEYKTQPVPEGLPVPVEPQDVTVGEKAHTCTLSVRCDTILKNIAWLDKNKAELVPDDGVIFAEKQVAFYEGESVFNLLVREMKKNKIHLEFMKTPIYNSAYIEGIANLYEFDCGELSGWKYKVNGWFPNYGSSRYQLNPDDKVEWVYTCDMGLDVGGYSEVWQKDE